MAKFLNGSKNIEKIRVFQNGQNSMCVKPDIFKYSNRGKEEIQGHQRQKKKQKKKKKKKKKKEKRRKKHRGIGDLPKERKKKRRKKFNVNFWGGWVGKGRERRGSSRVVSITRRAPAGLCFSLASRILSQVCLPLQSMVLLHFRIL